MKEIPQKNLGSSTVWSMTNNFISQILVLVIFLITARFVKPEEFGMMAICFLVVDGFRQIFVESIGITITSRSPPDRNEYNSAFFLMMATSFFSAIVVFAMADVLSAALNNPELSSPLKYVSLLICAMGFTRVQEAWLARHFMFKQLAIRSILAISIGGAIGIFLAIQGFGIWALIIQQLVSSFISIVVLWLSSSWRPSFEIHREKMFSLIKDSKHIAFSRGLGFCSGQGDILFASYYLGAVSTGVFSAAKRIMSALENILDAALTSVAVPAFADARKDSDGGKLSYLSALRFTAFLTTPLLAGISIMADEIVWLLLGDSWKSVAPIISILCINSILTSWLMYHGPLMMVHRKFHWQSSYSIAMTICSIALMFIFARFGLIFIAAAFLIRTLLFFPVSLLIALKLLNLRTYEFFACLFPSATASCVMTIALLSLKYVIPDNELFKLIICVPTGVMIYVLVTFFLDKRILEEIVDFAKIYKNRDKKLVSKQDLE